MAEYFMLQDSVNKAKVLSFLMKQKKSGKLPGVCGRLGDLGEKYNVQVSAFAFNCIVVDTIDTAARCIELLSEHNVGRASFIALDAHESYPHESINMIFPDGVSELFDKIRLELKSTPPDPMKKVNRKRKCLQQIND